MSEKEVQLLTSASEIFMINGVKSMTMDDIARALKMSKKTLYKYVKDKNDLVCKSMSLILDIKQCEFEEICSTVKDPIEELWQITTKAARQFKAIHPSVMYDIQRFHPEAWDYFEKHKNSHIYDCVVDNLKRGQDSGVYRENINAEVISKVYVARFDILFNHKVFPPSEYALVDIHSEMMDYHFYGILSEKGVKEFKEYELKKIS